MKTLVALHLVQFSFWEYETFDLAGDGTAFIGPNGAGKTSLVDAIQIALVGANRNYLQFNAQSVHKDARSLRDYALGTMRSGEGEKGALTRKRDEALSYITMVFADGDSGDQFSAGLCMWSTEREPQARVMGLYVLPGVRLLMDHHLVDEGDEGKAPQDWSVFEAQARSLCAAAGRTPTFTSKPESYLDELLHNLADSKASIDPRKFLKALKQSIKLKDVNSVSDFLRDNLVDASRIDRKGTLRHIQTLRQLAAQIEEVKLQLAQLDTLNGRHDNLHRLHRVRATVRAVAAQLQVESADAQVVDLRVRLEGLEAQRLEAVESEALRQQAVRSTFDAYEALRDRFNKDPGAAAPEQARALRAALQDARKTLRQDVDRLDLSLGQALQSLAVAFEGRYVAGVQGAARASRAWDGRRGRLMLPSIDQVRETLRSLEQARPAIEALAESDRKGAEQAQQRKEAAEEKLGAASRGVRVRDDDVASAMRLFSQAGIGCHTVASVVSVRDLDWQCAIETFLGRNRLAVVVEHGRERDAVALIRRERINDVTIVQPSHLTDVLGRQADSGSVANLLVSKDKVALAFLTRLLGRMRCVETEAELERHDRALTKDGMLSANGGTRRMRPVPVGHFVLGVQVSSADLAELRAEARQAHETLTAANLLLNLSRNARDSNARTRLEVTLDGFSAAMTAHEAALSKEAAAKESAGEDLPEHLQELQLQVDAARARSVQAQAEHHEVGQRITKLQADQDYVQRDLNDATAKLEQLQGQAADAKSDQDFDPEMATVRLAIAYQRGAALRAEAVEELQAHATKTGATIEKHVGEIASEFTEFINRHSIALVEERSDWRKAAVWVKGHIHLLRHSTLGEYDAQAKTAREAAERAFESDVKYSLREALRRVEREIRDLNAILDRCPPFTNGERYHFSARTDEQHRALYNLVMHQAADGESSSLFSDGDVRSKLVQLMESAEHGTDKGNNPLEDYRLFYQFDLEIRVDGKVVDLLSKRMGVASNGEHRVPFYVIAGAALATAYRIKPGEQHRGAGVMILDEAFYGIDAQNTVVTAEFLKSLGLQLIMAGPDSDTSKLTAVLDSYYDLTRFGPDVFVELVRIKDKARALMQSDMPERNPGLFAKRVEQLALEAR
ncbi:SbcC/MukB-like Walker B domain-containing protein [Variovorax rhizosphaerae]|uniref:SbcC/MukB-like Walker B domain-containing protein n=1 Tax=Variovorax rhizosphaerae TaxID=1836200 RepID=A0ABU8WRL2_9BURK